MTESHLPKLKQHSLYSQIFLTVNFKPLCQFEWRKIIQYDKNVWWLQVVSGDGLTEPILSQAYAFRYIIKGLKSKEIPVDSIPHIQFDNNPVDIPIRH